jgi:hypothetical protein
MYWTSVAREYRGIVMDAEDAEHQVNERKNVEQETWSSIEII